MALRIFYLLGVVFMTSCVSVKFSTPQPADTAEMPSFPKSWRGRYVTMTDDTLFIGHNRLVFKDSLKEEKYIIGQQIVLKKSDKYLVINVKNEQNWDVVLAEKKRKALNLYALDISEEEQKKIGRIAAVTPVKTVKNSEGKVDYYLISPSGAHFEKLIKEHLFSPFIAFEKIK
jgi:hypothetical protein